MLTGMLPPSGDQFEIRGGGYRAVITECGAALRVLEYDGRALVDGYPEDAMASGGRGQILMPWANRIRDGRYEFEGQTLQLGLSEATRHNASHGLVRWVAWTVEEHSEASVSLVYRLMAQTGYPWTVDLHVLYDLSADGLTVTQTATNMSGSSAPYACGAHPYLALGDGPVDVWELTMPAATRLLTDDRLLPVGSESVEGTPYDFRVTRPIRDAVLDDTFTDLSRDSDDQCLVSVTDGQHGVVLWGGPGITCFQVFTADGTPTARRSLAVEPMTAPPDAFRSGEGLTVLAADGGEHSVSWGIRVAG